MKTIFDHIEHVKGMPRHIRERVAFASAALITALIAFVWVAGSLSSGAFAIHSGSFTDIAGQGGAAATATGDTSGSQSLAGAGAAAALGTDAPVPAHIEIVDATSSTPKVQAEQTTIPF